MYQNHNSGWIEVICGPMYSNKTTTLIERLTALTYAKKDIVAFKPNIDNRYAVSDIATHEGEKYPSIPVKDIEEAKDIINNRNKLPDVIGIDEIQFFDKSSIDILEDWARRGIRVIVAGLDLDFKGIPFEIMKELMPRAEFITKLSAVCTVCGCAATRSQRLIDGKPAPYDSPLIMVGAKETYEARCRKHHEIPE